MGTTTQHNNVSCIEFVSIEIAQADYVKHKNSTFVCHFIL
jgi:hypothetical protein